MKQLFLKYATAGCMGGLLLSGVTANAQPEFVWVEQVGSSNNEYGKSVTVDPKGNVYTAGEFKDMVSLRVGNQTATIISKGGSDIFLTKQDTAGNFLWVKSFGGNRDEKVNDIAVNSQGDILITGSFIDTVDFDPGTQKEEHTAHPNSRGSAGQDFFISRFNTNGDFVWVKVGGNVGNDAGNGVAFDKQSDEIYFTGNFGSGDLDLDFGQGTVSLRNTGGTASVVLKMKADGSIIWGSVLGDNASGSVTANDIAVDKDKNVYTTGTYSNTADFDPDTSGQHLMTAVAKGDVFVSKLDASGHFVWAKSMGGYEVDQGNAIAVDDEQQVYFTGSFQTIANFDPNGTANLSTLGGSDVFISKLHKDGSLAWAVNVGSRTDDVGDGIALDRLGNVYTTGWFQSPRSEFNPGTQPEDTFNLVSYGSLDGFILKLDNDANFVWAVNVGSSSGAEGSKAIAVGGGYVYTTGNFYRTADFDPAGPNLNQLTSVGMSDAFILKLKECLPLAGADISISGADSVCNGEAYVYTVSYHGAAAYRWQLPQGWTGASDSDKIIATAGNSGTIRVMVYSLCDSMEVDYPVTLAMNTIDITVDGMQLGVTHASEHLSWQWFLDGNQITGATDSVYVVTKNGIYSVVATGKSGCIDTAFYTVTNAGVLSSQHLSDLIHIYPNPASEKIQITSPEAVTVSLISMDGRMLYQTDAPQVAKTINVTSLSPGIYIIQVRNREGALVKVEKLVVNPSY